MTEIAVHSPSIWWRADAAALRRFAARDPDVEDGYQRWPDREKQRWALIARAVAEVSDALAAGDWAPREDVDRQHVAVDVDADHLTPTELRIVRAWFSDTEAVQHDPWWDPVDDGRHRLWNTLNHFSDELVPVSSAALGHVTSASEILIGETWPRIFAAHLDDLEELAWFDHADPLNRRFTEAIRSISRGELPSAI